MTSKAAERFLNILGSSPPTDDTLTKKAIVGRRSKILTQARAAELAQLGKDELTLATEASGVRAAKDHLPRVLADGEVGLEKLRQAGTKAELTAGETLGLEAIVVSTGERPSQALTNCGLDFGDTRLGMWRKTTKDFERQIARICQSVGRINLSDSHIGTGFAIAPELVLTNRHVLQSLGHEENGKWTLREGASIDFAGDGTRAGATPFQISDVVLTTDKEIDMRRIDFAKIDLAVLRCAAGPHPFPAGVMLNRSTSDLIEGIPVYAIGFPGKPLPGAEEFSLLRSIFDFKFGVKRYSPGEIEFARLDRDPKHTVFSHDCTTLGGSSGSAIVDLGADGLRVFGLHFGGTPRTGNYAHSVAAIRHMLADYASYLDD